MSCLFDGSESGWTYREPHVREDLRAAFYKNGATVTVSCVERHGETVTDIAGTVSAVLGRPTEVYVLHAVTGYANVADLPSC